MDNQILYLYLSFTDVWNVVLSHSLNIFNQGLGNLKSVNLIFLIFMLNFYFNLLFTILQDPMHLKIT